MASPLLTVVRPRLFNLSTISGIGLGLTGLVASQSLFQRRSNLLRCDGSLAGFSSSASQEFKQYQRDAKAPVVKSGRLNPSAVRQISAGSISGLLGGLAVSMFSKPLALLIGLLVFGVQALESRGIHIVPYKRLQGVFNDTNMRSLIEDNVAFKLCFGATFALAAFAEF